MTTMTQADNPYRVPFVERTEMQYLEMERGYVKLLIRLGNGLSALSGTMLTNHPASAAFGTTQRRLHMIDRIFAARRAQYFPSTASFRINASSVRLDTALRSR